MKQLSHELDSAWIARTYGAFVPVKSLAKLLGFPTPAALRRARATGRLPLPLFELEGRRGLFAHASDVGGYLRQKAPYPQEDPMS